MKPRKKINPYIEPTVELVLSLLADAYEDQKKLIEMIEILLEEFEISVKQDLDKLIKDGLLHLDMKIDLENHPRLYMALKDIERKELRRFVDWCWMGAQVIKESMMRSYKDTMRATFSIYNRTEFGILPDFLVEQTVVLKPWCQDGKIFSDRLYSHLLDYQNKLAIILEQGIRKGKGYEWMLAEWKKLTDSTFYEFERLLKTETMAMWSKATKKVLLSIGVEYVEIVGDAVCGGICLDYVGDAVPLEEAEMGDLLPPYHPNCACSFVEYTEEILEEEQDNFVSVVWHNFQLLLMRLNSLCEKAT